MNVESDLLRLRPPRKDVSQGLLEPAPFMRILTACVVRRAQGTLSPFGLWSKALLSRNRSRFDVNCGGLEQIGLTNIGNNRSVAHVIAWKDGWLYEIGLVGKDICARNSHWLTQGQVWIHADSHLLIVRHMRHQSGRPIRGLFGQSKALQAKGIAGVRLSREIR